MQAPPQKLQEKTMQQVRLLYGLYIASVYEIFNDLYVQLMAPFTPFFCESLYQNLKRALPAGSPESVHWCSFPDASAAQVERLSLQPKAIS